MHIAAEPVNTALLQQLWQLSLDNVHIQEYLGCVQLREFVHTLCAIKRSLKCIEYQNHHEVWRGVSFSVHWSEKVWENISEFQRDNFDTSSCDKENCVAVRLEGILTNFNQICFSAFTRESFKSVTYRFMNW